MKHSVSSIVNFELSTHIYLVGKQLDMKLKTFLSEERFRDFCNNNNYHSNTVSNNFIFFEWIGPGDTISTYFCHRIQSIIAGQND